MFRNVSAVCIGSHAAKIPSTLWDAPHDVNPRPRLVVTHFALETGIERS